VKNEKLKTRNQKPITNIPIYHNGIRSAVCGKRFTVCGIEREIIV